MKLLTRLKRIKRQGNPTALVLLTSVVVLIVVMLYTVLTPPLRWYQNRQQERQLYTQAAEQGLPVGTIRTYSGVGGGIGATPYGMASGHLAASPSAVLAHPGVRPGSFGWTLFPDCGKGLVCFASSGKDYILTLTVHPCTEIGCPAGGSQIDADVSRGGPNS